MAILILFCSHRVKGENLFSYNVKIKLAFENIIDYSTSQQRNKPSLSRLIAESEAGRESTLPCRRGTKSRDASGKRKKSDLEDMMDKELIKEWERYAVRLVNSINYTGINTKAHYAKIFVAFIQCK